MVDGGESAYSEKQPVPWSRSSKGGAIAGVIGRDWTMTDLTLESLRSELAQSLHSELAPIRAQLESLRSEQAPIRAQLDSLRSEQAPIRAQLDSLRSELAPIRAQLDSLRSELAPMRAQLDGLPLINRALTVLQQDMRSLRAAFNDFARTNITAGEVEALHFDVNRVQAENAELQARLATVERLLQQLQKERS
jgi:chromosome segregation ATPase